MRSDSRSRVENLNQRATRDATPIVDSLFYYPSVYTIRGLNVFPGARSASKRFPRLPLLAPRARNELSFGGRTLYSCGWAKSAIRDHFLCEAEPMRHRISIALLLAIVGWPSAPLMAQIPKAEPKRATPTAIMGKDLASFVKEMRESTDASARENAIRALPLFADARKAASANLLNAITSDADENVRIAAISIVPTVGFDTKENVIAGFNALLKIIIPMNGESIRLRYEAIMAFANCGPSAMGAIPVLVEHSLKDATSWQNRKAAAYALGRLGLPFYEGDGPEVKAVHALAACLRTETAHQVRREAMNSLLMIGAPQATTTSRALREAITQAQKDADPVVVIWAHVISIRDAEEPIDAKNPDLLALMEFLTQPDPALKREALQALANVGQAAKYHLTELIAFIKNEKQDPVFVGMAIAVLERMPSERAKILPVIEPLTKHKDPTIKQAAEEARKVLTPRFEFKKDEKTPVPK